MDISEILNKIKIVNTNVRYINYGGCGFFAYLLYKKLKVQNIITDIYLYGDIRNPIHIILKIDDNFFDSDGIFNENNNFNVNIGAFYKIELTDLENMLENVSWNKKFDTYFSDNNFNVISNKNKLFEIIEEIF